MPMPPRLPLLSDAVSAAESLLQVGDLARETGKTVRAIHLYEELELLRPAGRSKGRYRLYARDALVRIRWISKLQDLGLSLSDIQTIVREWEAAGSANFATEKMRVVYAAKLAETKTQIEKLRALERELGASLDYLSTCGDVCEPARLLSDCKSCDLHAHHSDAHDCHASKPIPELVLGFRAHPL